MNVLHVIHPPVFGGPHNQALRLDPVYRTMGISATVLLPDDPESAAGRLLDAGVDVVTMPLQRMRATLNPHVHLSLLLSLRSEIRMIREVIRDRKIDVVEMGMFLNPQAALAARREGVPVVWQIVDTRTPTFLRYCFRPLVRRLSDALMFDGEALVEPHFGSRLPNVPVIIYYPPVDTTRFVHSKERRQATRLHAGIPADAKVVGMVANLNPQKGIEFFIEAAHHINRVEPDCWFVVVGAVHATHVAYRDSLTRMIQGTRLERKFIWAGARRDVEVWYPAMDVKVISSLARSEGTTTTAMEAMSCGVPVVATDVGAIREVVDDGRTGLLVDPEDSLSLARACIAVVTNREMARGLAEAGRSAAVERFDVSVCARTHQEAFIAAIEHAGTRSGSRPS